MPTLQGFTSPRYQNHDILISKLVKEFNTNKALFVGGSAAQVSKIPNLTEVLVKSWIIEESGGSDSRSLQAWKIDPAQVNVPGDWSTYKLSTGLTAPAKSLGRFFSFFYISTIELNRAVFWRRFK